MKNLKINSICSVICLFALIVVSNACKKSAVSDQEKIRSLLTHRSLGLAYLEESQLDQAAAEFKHIIEIAPEEALGHANLALTLLRKAQYSEAEKQVRKALGLTQEPEVVLILAEILERSGRADAAIQDLEKSAQTYPMHVSSQYKLAQMYLRSSRADRYRKAEGALAAVQSSAPANLPAKLYLAENLVRNNKTKEAMALLREVRQIVSSMPAGSEEFMTRALRALEASNSGEALPSIIALHNFLKPTPIYQAGIFELSGPGGALTGFPVIHFSSRISNQVQSKPLEHIRFVAASETALPSTTQISADWDNDGNPEKCEIRDGAALVLMDHNGKTLQEVKGKFSGALFFDFDQDGDLDLYSIGEARALRNNGEGSFSDRTDAMKLRRSGRSTSAAIGDFDDDGDVDLFVTDPSSGDILYDNLREGRFQPVTERAGLTGFSNAASIADYDQDGLLDIFVTGRHSVFYQNQGNGTFSPDKRSASLNKLTGKTASFLDFDNDGFQDLAIAGEKISLFRNNARGVFRDASAILPSRSVNISKLDVHDQDSDGDLDLQFTTAKSVQLWRNDGGNANRWLKVRLSGLGTGSGKNNRDGIGAKLELMAGDLYQMRIVTDPLTHLGLGSRQAADVLRVVWTNGVPQNHVKPQSNQIVVEKQILKGSCPFVYAWTGEKYEFVTDIMWKSALGMPLGIMAGSAAYAFPNSSDEFLRIPGSQLKPKDGHYSIQITEELWETAYLDKTRLVAVDHPDTVEIYIDEKFVVPPFPKLQVYTVAEKIYPLSATDHDGANALPRISSKDDQYVGNFRAAAFQGITEEHDLILDLGRFDKKDRITLFLRGWIFPSDASINMALSQSSKLKTVAPYLQVMDRSGKWQTVIPSLSFPMGKDKTMIVDLTGKFLSSDHRIRIRTTMEIYWDEIFYTRNEPSVPLHMTTMKPVSADLHYRGFSRMYRKNVLGPHWFDYSDVDPKPKWRDLEGNYTRFGDVTPLLQESDSMFVILNAGDEITIRFDEKQAPRIPSRWTRDFLLYSDGWIKDGDLNTAHSKTVEPLPFQGIHSYPYSSKDQYPTDPAHRDYLKTYNTRSVKPNLKFNTKDAKQQF